MSIYASLCDDYWIYKSCLIDLLLQNTSEQEILIVSFERSSANTTDSEGQLDKISGLE